jgi:hypothetical protein
VSLKRIADPERKRGWPAIAIHPESPHVHAIMALRVKQFKE